MSEMIERVARAIAAAYNCDADAMACGQIPAFLSHPRLGVHGAHLKLKDEDYMPVWRLFVPQARAAIIAMRQPTDEQRNAYYELSYKTSTMDDARWERAIDAALT